MESQLPRVCVLSQYPEVFLAVQKALPHTEVIDVRFPERDSHAWIAEEKQKIFEAEILLADADLVRKHNLIHLSQLKWMHLNNAGVDEILKSIAKTKTIPSYRLTRLGSGYDIHMAEYVLGMIISRERRFPEMARDQQNKLWKPADYANYRLLPQLTLGILGLGSIGRGVAKAVKTLGMQVWGLGSQEGIPRTPCSYIDEYRGPSGLIELLSQCDYVCNILPSTPKTTGLLSGNVLSHCRHKPILINIGRGDVISEESIVNALSHGWISGAVLDVCETEPLPPTSPLWDHPDVTITPHTAGACVDISGIFTENYKLYMDGKPLKHEVDWENGY